MPDGDAMQRARLARGGRGGDTPMGKFEKAAKGIATPEHPQYTKSLTENDGGPIYMITVDEGWRSWILCTDMYEWAADQLIRILQEAEVQWPR